MNTPRDRTASIEHTEYLWRKHFGYGLQPAKRFDLLLDDLRGWSDADWDINRQQYHQDYPEYRIVAGESSEGFDYISYFYDDERMLYADLKLDYLTTTLYETELWYMDLGRCIIPKPEKSYIIGRWMYYYFLKDSINGKLLGLFTNGKYICTDRKGLVIPILIFENEDEKTSFEEFFLRFDESVAVDIKNRIQENGIMKHIVQKEESEGKLEIRVTDIAFSYAVYQRWVKENLE